MTREVPAAGAIHTPVAGSAAAWLLACRAAGCPGRRLHDLRRTAVRDLDRAGVSRTVAMKMVGMKTEAIYRRYNIIDEERMREEAEKLNMWATGSVPKDTKKGGQVRQFKKRAAGAR